MQIKRVKSITPKSEYFQEILLSDGKNTFYNSKNRVFIHDGKQTMTFPIKKILLLFVYRWICICCQ